jgi:hypothetical protein
VYSFVSVDTTDVMCVTPFSTAASGVYDEITSEELKERRTKEDILKWRQDMKRY